MASNGVPYIGSTSTRVSGQLSRNMILSNIRRTNDALLDLQRQLSSGNKLETPSDDPITAQLIMKYESHIRESDQFIKSGDMTKNKLSFASSSLDGLTDIVSRAQSISLEAMSDTTSSEARSSLAYSVNEMITEAMNVGNSMFEGKFLFGGTVTNKSPFQLVGNSVVYNGNVEESYTSISKNSQVASSIAGSEIFGALSAKETSSTDLDTDVTYGGAVGSVTTGGANNTFTDLTLAGSGLNSFLNLEVVALTGANAGERRMVNSFNNATGAVGVSAAFTNNFTVNDTYEIRGVSTRLSDVNAGEGVSLGSITISDGGNVRTVDLSFAESLADVIDKINGAFSALGTLTAGINASGNGLLVQTSTGSLLVQEVNGGNTAADLGIEKTVAAGGSRIGDDLDALITMDTAVTLFNGGAGVDRSAAGGLKITNGSYSQDIAFDDVYTVRELASKIENAGVYAGIEVAEGGRGVNLYSRLMGERLSITEVGGSTASDMGIRYTLDKAKLSELNGGIGIDTDKQGDDFRVTLMSGATIDIDISGAETVQDVIDLINNDAQNTALGSPLLAQIDPVFGDRLQLVDSSVDGGNNFKVEMLNLSNAAADLGIMTSVVNPVGVDASLTLTGTGISPSGRQARSIFAVLNDLKTGLANNDTSMITRASIKLSSEIELDVIDGIGVLGSKVSRLEMSKTRFEEESAQLEIMWSEMKFSDLAEIATAFQMENTILQAGLASAASILQLNLMNYL